MSAFDDLLKIGALRPAEPSKVVDCEGCFDDHSCKVEFDHDVGAWFYRCPEAGRMQANDDQILGWSFGVDWFLGQVGQALGLAKRQQRCLHEGRLWDLGEAKTGRTSWTAMVGRSLKSTHDIDQLSDQLSRRSVDPPGLVFLGCLDLPERIQLPRGHQLASIERSFEWQTGKLQPIDSTIGSLLRDRSRSSESGGRRGRPPADLGAILEIYHNRVRDGDAILIPKRSGQKTALVNKSKEAQTLFDIARDKWPDLEIPAVNTIRKHL